MTCASCGEPLTSTNPRARYCSVNCRVKASQRRAKGIPELKRAAPAVDTPPIDGGVRASALRELAEAGRAESTAGRAALALAARIDAQADTGAGLASAVKQLQATMAEALRGAEAGDILDELSARREARRGA